MLNISFFNHFHILLTFNSEKMEMEIDEEVPFLPVEMFEHIISFCNWSMILKLSETNVMFRALAWLEIRKRLKKSHQKAINRGFIKEKFSLSFCMYGFQYRNGRVKEVDYTINVSSIRLILRFLRLFGDQIKVLTLDFYGCSEKRGNAIFSAVCTYCPNLYRIVFTELKHSLKKSLMKPLKGVKSISFDECHMKDKLCRLGLYFPDLEQLYISNNSHIENPKAVMIRYRNLKNFYYSVHLQNVLHYQTLRNLNLKTRIIHVQ